MDYWEKHQDEMEAGVLYCCWCSFSERDGDVWEHEMTNHDEENNAQHLDEYGHLAR